MLCARCLKKQRKGRISESDIHVSKALVTLVKKYPQLQSISLKKTVKVEDTFVLGVMKKSQSVMDDSSIRKALEITLGFKVKIVALTNDFRVVLASLFSPLEVLGVDKVFVPDGSQELKVRLKGKIGEANHSISSLCKMASALLTYSVRANLVPDLEKKAYIDEDPEY